MLHHHHNHHQSQRPRRRCEGTAMGVIILDLRPGNGIGPFSLGKQSIPVKRHRYWEIMNWIFFLIFWFWPFFLSGMPICEAFAQIEQQPSIYDVVHVKYFDEVFVSISILRILLFYSSLRFFDSFVILCYLLFFWGYV
jgi:hypothetical protein